MVVDNSRCRRAMWVTTINHRAPSATFAPAKPRAPSCAWAPRNTTPADARSPTRTRKVSIAVVASFPETTDATVSLMATREPLYRELADLTVDTDGRKVRAVANEIVDRL